MKAFLHSLLHEHKRQTLTLLMLSFAASVLFTMDIFSYLSGKDMVTNKLTAKNGSVILSEPAWDREGQYMAARSEQGMKISKDPYAVNDGEIDIYVRLKMTIELEDFIPKEKNNSYNSTYNYEPETRINAILDAIKLKSGEPFLDDNRTETKNDSFYMATETADGSPVFYFYYIGDNNGDMAVVKPGGATDALFDDLIIPINKKDYYGVFDQKYEIILTAEGIPAANYPDGLKANEAAEEFK